MSAGLCPDATGVGAPVPILTPYLLAARRVFGAVFFVAGRAFVELPRTDVFGAGLVRVLATTFVAGRAVRGEGARFTGVFATFASAPDFAASNRSASSSVNASASPLSEMVALILPCFTYGP